MPETMSEARPDRIGMLARRLPAIAAATGATGFALLIALAFATEGVFEYPLDDVYIHLAMASQIANGGYGVNAGEYASAASSILYPLLLTPFADSDLQRYLPLFWNLVGLLAASFLWGRLLLEAGFASRRLAPLGILLAAFGPLALNIAGVAFLGMEHALQLAATLAVAAGLVAFLRRGEIGWLLIAGVIVGPMLRFECLIVSGLACGVLLFNGRPVVAVLAGLAALAPLAGYMAFLHSIGLDVVPNSINAKAFARGEDVSRLENMATQFATNIRTIPGVFMALLIGFWLVAGPSFAALRRGPALWLWLAVVVAGLVHLLFGRMGWMNRYEDYAVAWMLALSLAVIAPLMLAHRMVFALGWLACVGTLSITTAHYYARMVKVGPIASRSIHLQQAQMARFVDDYVRAPVAVNDLGHVAWRNPHYVLDLWGLASEEALATRYSDPAPGWTGPLVAEHGVALVMIYDRWFGAGVDPAWIRLGELRLTVPSAAVAVDRVAFYAPDAAAAERLKAPLEAFAKTLPAGAVFDFEPGAGS